MPAITRNNKFEVRDLTLILLLIVLSALVRFSLLFTIEWVVEPDSVIYLEMAKVIRQDNFRQIGTLVHPLYPFLISKVSFIFNDLEFSGRVVSCIGSTLLVLPVFLIAAMVFDRKVAVFSSLLAIFCPGLTVFSCKVLTESTYCLLLTSAILFGLLALFKNRLFYVVAGIALAFAYLTRPEGIIYTFPVLFGIFYSGLSLREAKIKALMINLSLFVIPFILCSLPYVLFLHEKLGYWTLAERLTLFSGGRADSAIGTLRFLVFPSGWPSLIRRYIINVYAAYTREFGRIFRPVMIMLLGLGLFARPWRRDGMAKQIFPLLFPLTQYLLLPTFRLLARYISHTIPVLLIWAGYGLVVLLTSARATSDNIQSKRLVWAKKVSLSQYLVIAVVMLSLIPETLIPILGGKLGRTPSEALEYKQVGLWMKDNLPAGSQVMCRQSQFGYYAEMEVVGLSQEWDWRETFEEARENKVDYIVIDERYTVAIAPQLAFLLDEAEAPVGLKLIYKCDKYPSAKVVVYRFEY